MVTFKEKFASALFGTPTVDYGAENKAYMDELAKQKAFQDLAQRNDLTTEQALGGVMQGLNYGDKGIALRQQELGINTPQNAEQIALARQGLLNDYTTRQGGLINDLTTGYKENLTQAYNPQNLQPQGKNLATKIGEGLGTAVRTYNKPLGRGLLAGAAALALGGGGADALMYGLATGVGRQNIETADKVYRNQLKQLGMSDEELNNIKGNITKEIFEGVTSGMKLGNQRMTYGQLAMLDDEIAEEVRLNPALAAQFVPVNFARDIYSKKRDSAEGKMAKVAAEIKKIEKETKYVGEPKVNINIRKGGTNSTVTHVGGSGGNNRPTKPVDYKNKYGLE
jgi:hypothetical protein